MIDSYKIPIAFFLFVLLIIFCTRIQAQTKAPEGKYFFVLTFSEAMDTNTTRDLNNYEVFDDSLNMIPILAAGVPHEPGTLEAVDSMIILLVDVPEYKTTYSVRVSNVTDIAGNPISENGNSAWYYFDGFDINEPQPYLIVK